MHTLGEINARKRITRLIKRQRIVTFPEIVFVYSDCHEVYSRGFLTSGVYQVKPRDALQLDNVYCEMINGTGWTVLSRRSDGTLR